jgi:hypothetical protein
MQESCVFFRQTRNTHAPYVSRFISLEDRQTEGSMVFDGHYYIEDSELPDILTFSHAIKEGVPYKVEDGVAHYRTKKHHLWIIEVYARELGEETTVESEVWSDDESKPPQKVFPTHIQTLQFRIIERMFG